MNFTKTEHHDTYPPIQNQTTTHKNHSVLITGASRGVGLATATSFARAGASPIILAARSNLDSAESTIKTAATTAGHPPPQVLKLTLDVSDEASVNAAKAQVEQNVPNGGGLDVLVNNAGYLENWTPLGQSDSADWWRSFEVNVRGVYLMIRAFIPLLLRGSSGGDVGKPKMIVNVSSRGALLVRPTASAYQVGKFALLRLSEFVATEYGPGSEEGGEGKGGGIVTISIHPGGVATDLALHMPEHLHGLLHDSAALAGDTISWLTKEQREWLNGRYVSVVWDMPELEARKEEIVAGDKLKMKMVV